jgi:hypothetical protein
MKYIKTLSIAVISAFAFMPLSMIGEETPKAAEKAEKKTEAGKPIPLYGDVAAVDKAAKTFSITHKKGDTVYVVTADTKITKKGAPATFDDIAVGAYVKGSYAKTGDKNVTHTLKVGEEKPAKGDKKAEKPADKPADKPAEK